METMTKDKEYYNLSISYWANKWREYVVDNTPKDTEIDGFKVFLFGMELANMEYNYGPVEWLRWVNDNDYRKLYWRAYRQLDNSGMED